MMFKKYLKVIALCNEQSELVPMYIIWNDGRKYRIDKILETRKAASPVGGCGTLYRCLINGKERRLFYEIDRWFIESYKP